MPNHAASHHASPRSERRSEQFLQHLREACLTRVGIDVRFLSGMPALRRAAVQLDAMAATERLSVLPRLGLRAAKPVMSATVTRLVVPPGLASGPSVDHLRELSATGAHIRVSPCATHRLTVVNRTIAVADLSIAGRSEGVRIRHADLIRGVVAHFEELWHSAVPLAGSDQVTLERFTPRQRRILELLAEGMTDEMVSRELGLSTRSVRAEVAAIRQVLGAASRFEAGMKYAALRAE